MTGGDVELQDYLGRMAGYALTGCIDEHALFFAYGTGANGKSTFTFTLAALLGDYATAASMDALTACKGERHPTEIASLRGARLVTAAEVEEGRKWAESKIKLLTGGTTISARFMRCDFFEFAPGFKLFVEGNHLPGLSGVDEATRRRMHIIPFTVTVPVEQRDPKLRTLLQKEWPGILDWAVAGCLRWQKSRLVPRPTAVEAATASYLETEDSFGAWIAECCSLSPRAEVTSRELFDSFRTWARQVGEQPCSIKSFSQLMQARGFVKRPIGHSRTKGFVGISLRPI